MHTFSHILLETRPIAGSLCKNSVRYVACIQGSAEGQREDIAGSGLAEGFRTVVYRGPGGKDIVDQENTLVGNRLRMSDVKRIAQIVQPLLPREGRLRRC